MTLVKPTRQAALPDGFIDRISAIVGPRGVLTDGADLAPYVREERGNYEGATPLVVRPANTAEVADVVRTCAEATVPIVPQGGNTGLTGATVTNGELLLSLGRMNQVREIDPLNFTMTVEAGCILADAQAAAEAKNRLFPLSLGAEGSCQIGGNLSTNAGGTAVLRYGNMRELTLGLEVVLPDGQIWNGLRGLRKDNTGYDLKHLFIGAEGTLGIITAAVLKLFPLPKARHTAFVAVTSIDTALSLLAMARDASADAVATCELIPRVSLEAALRHIEGTRDPLSQPHDTYVLLEFWASDGDTALRDALEGVLAEAHERGLVHDATIAESEAQRQQLWHIREAIVYGQRKEGASIKNDVSVPVSRVAAFIERANAAVTAACPGIRPFAFGHIGDGNIHYNLSQPPDANGPAFLARWDEITNIVNEIALDLGGSFSAEHGIGLIKREELARYKTAPELDLMRRVKQALDPRGIMNPGKVLQVLPAGSRLSTPG